MNQQDKAPYAPKTYIASAHAHALDLFATLFLFVSVSVMAGRIWRFPFDDEIATLSKIEPDAGVQPGYDGRSVAAYSTAGLDLDLAS
jgi:hypothetical protein